MPLKVFYLIDDDPDEQIVFEEALEELNGTFKLFWRSDGVKALQELRANVIVPDYIFIDINMPRINGWECLKTIRSIQHLNDTPVAMYSTSATISSRMNGACSQLANICIDKRSSIAELSQILQSFLVQYP